MNTLNNTLENTLESLSKNEIVSLQLNNGTTLQGRYLGFCEDGTVILDVETSLGLAIVETHISNIESVAQSLN